MAAIRYRAFIVHALRLTALVCLFALAGCTSSGKLPNPAEQEDLSTFRLARVTAKAATQPTAADTNKSLVTVTFTTKVASAATGTLEPAGMKFDIFEGDHHIASRTLEWEGEIQWQKTFSVEKGVDYPYQTLTFRIVGQSPHRGTRTVCLEVNPTATGESVAFDCTNGSTRAPVASAGGQPKLAADGTVTNDTLAEFYVRSMKVVTNEPDLDQIDPVTRQPRRLLYGIKTCIGFLKQDRPKMRPKQTFVVEGFGKLSRDEVSTLEKNENGPLRQVKTTDDEGCFEFASSFDDFKFVTAKRSFARSVRICAENDVVRRECKDHRIYVDPWEPNETVIFAGGQDLKLIGREPNPKLVDAEAPCAKSDETCLKNEKSRAALNPPRIQLNGYVTNFTGRKFSIHDDLSMSSQRTYDFAFKPFLERWAGTGYKPFDLNGGKFNVKLLLLKSHGETPDEFPLNEEGIKARVEEELCFHKEDPFDLVADESLRARCYARAFLDYKEVSVEVKGGEFNFSTSLNFPDMRYIFSKNLLYIEIEPDEETEQSGIQKSTFVGLFFPLEDRGLRLRDGMKRAFDFAPTNDVRDQVRVDFESVFSRWEKDEMDESVKSYLNKIAREFPDKEGPLLTEALEMRERSNLPKDKAFIDDSRQKREVVLHAIRNKYKPESIDKIMKLVNEARGKVTTLKDLRLGRSAQDGMAKVELYRRMNRLVRAEKTFGEDSREAILKSLTPRVDVIGQPSELESVLQENPATQAALREACELVYPVTNEEEAKAEAKKFRDAEWGAAIAAYSKQREVLCKIQDVITKKVYDNIDLDVTKLSGGCEDTRALCTRPIVSVKDSDRVSGFMKLRRYILPSTGDGNANGVCGVHIPEKENMLLTAIQSNDQNLLQRFLGLKGEAENATIEWLARQYLSQMPFSLVRAEVVRRFDEKSSVSQYRLGDILLDPRKIDSNNPAHQKFAARFQPRLKHERCKAAPLDYLSLDVSEHVLRVLGRPKLVRAGSTNISVYANLTQGESSSFSTYTGVSRQNVVQMSAKASMNTATNLQAGISFSGGAASVSATASERTDIGSDKTTSTSQTWYISETDSDVRQKGSVMGEGSSRTLNAEETTFDFKAEVLTCLSIQGLDRLTQRTQRGGILSCREKPETRDITETWYYTYLFFRNSNSAYHEASADFIMRPWTVIIRGQDQFEWFKIMLQNQALTIKLSPERVPNPDQPMSEAFDAYQNYRKRRDLPGLLRLKHLVTPAQVPASATK